MRTEFSGQLRERVSIHKLSEARSANGLQQEVWENCGSCWAAIVPDGCGTETEAMALSAAARFRVTVRTGLQAEPGYRLAWGSKRLSIRQVVADPRHADRLVLRCEELRT